jgi:ectoine hydroxylase-related dioxygenase (phytanoyl-CoA dioxygenase family)
MLTPAQRSEFDRLGVTRLAAAIAANDVAHMRERLWDTLDKEHGIRSGAPETWTVYQPSGFQSLVRSGAFAPMAGSAVCEALDDLLGPHAWQRPRHWGQPLVTFPRRDRQWYIPHIQWHLDLPAPIQDLTLPGIRIFAFLDAVQPHGGGTLVATGSHRALMALAEEGGSSRPRRSADMRKALMRAEPWFRALCSQDAGVDRVARFMSDGCTFRGTRMQVIELTGEPGDVILMDLRLFHASGPNCGPAPRLMLAQAIYREPGKR